MSEVHYFSNGTEGSMWMAEHCDRCLHDHGTHRPEWDAEDGCPHILSLVLAQHDPVFIPIEVTGSTWQSSSWDCIEYRRCPCDRGPDDPGVEAPTPPDPNQGLLFDPTKVTPGVWRDVVLDELTPADHR